ncbi:MAG: 1-acyl-sn-glycerol-3-phosphate acyltransferase [Clostridiales bacterium]|nr:1-acyl-sn-glycerol-3-phosphate acyltransferase [Clostridiales bacterium]
MKIKKMHMDYDAVMSLPRPAHQKPKKPSRILSLVMRVAAIPDLLQVKFSYTKKDMEKAGKGPYLILMNHSSFLDLEMASKMLFPKRYNIVCTSDGFVGKEGLMRGLGCIPTQKFVSDISLITDIKHAVQKNHTSVLMYPEASYSFDGTATPLPRRMGVLFKALRVPVVMITTYGSFARDPLYNNLQKRKVKVSAEMACLLSAEEVESKSVDEIDEILDRAFSFDYFAWQRDNHIRIPETFRADGLHRILYKCTCCGKEGQMEGRGIELICHACGHKWELDEYGQLQDRGPAPEAADAPSFSHIPDWYAWERKCVREEIDDGRYLLDTEVDIGIIVDFESLYMVGSGTLRHTSDGFVLDGCDGRLHYTQSPKENYSLYSDYFWYEIGDVICIGKKDCLYYCFPKKKDVVAKTRIAAEELFKKERERRTRPANRKET